MARHSAERRLNTSRRLLERACEQVGLGETTLATSLFKIAARMGNTVAQVNLANLYDDGSSYDSSFRRSRYWYKRAWRSGQGEAAYNLAVAFRLRGDHVREERWLARAAALGDQDAADDLCAGAVQRFPEEEQTLVRF